MLAEAGEGAREASTAAKAVDDGRRKREAGDATPIEVHVPRDTDAANASGFMRALCIDSSTSNKGAEVTKILG